MNSIANMQIDDDTIFGQYISANRQKANIYSQVEFPGKQTLK